MNRRRALRMHNPKLARSVRRQGVHYYAAFSAEFVRSVLRQTVEPGSVVLDPWNGSGTTTSVCAARDKIPPELQRDWEVRRGTHRF